MGGDEAAHGNDRIYLRFQSTPPHGGRPGAKGDALIDIAFQSTPPHGGRPRSTRWRSCPTAFQSTPPHGGRHNQGGRIIVIFDVSIHAPAWGATITENGIGIVACVSIHAPAWGATCNTIGKSHFFLCFNPRPRMGGDPLGLLLLWATSSFNPRPRMGGDRRCPVVHLVGPDVSIHAPAWGATSPGRRSLHQAGRFNPRPRMGGDCVNFLADFLGFF